MNNNDKANVRNKQKRKNKNPIVHCKICGNENSIIKKYDLNVCRRCFKDIAKKIGFEKFD